MKADHTTRARDWLPAKEHIVATILFVRFLAQKRREIVFENISACVV